MRRLAPRPLEAALASLSRQLAPATALARIQAVWTDAVGPRVAAEAHPVSERDGVVTAACGDAVWAQELDLMGQELVARLNDGLDAAGTTRLVKRLRFVIGGR